MHKHTTGITARNLDPRCAWQEEGVGGEASSGEVLAAQPARLALRGDDQIGNKGSVFAICTVTSQPSQAMPLLTIIVDNAT